MRIIRALSTVASLSSIITESDISPERAKEDLHREIKTSSGDGIEGMFEDM